MNSLDSFEGIPENVCQGCGKPISQELVEEWSAFCDGCLEEGRNFG